MGKYSLITETCLDFVSLSGAMLVFDRGLAQIRTRPRGDPLDSHILIYFLRALCERSADAWEASLAAGPTLNADQ